MKSMEPSDERRLAVLIDADNTTPKWADAIFEEIATLGEASIPINARMFRSHQSAG